MSAKSGGSTKSSGSTKTGTGAPPVSDKAGAASKTSSTAARRSKSTTPKKPINIALQGGGAHGAFTWGVLDCLLEDNRLQIEAISGTSAGAMNAAVVADGLVKGGRDGAREALAVFWKAVADAGAVSPIQRTVWDAWWGNWSLDTSPSYLMFDILGRIASPYELNPLNLNPLLDLIRNHVDFDRVRSCNELQIFVSATNVETGRVRVFRRPELTPEMVMASACLPFMFQAIEVDGQPYWDGGYMGNPVLFPFFNTSKSKDIVIVQINPIVREGTPRTARDILNRVNEITFNASLMREFRAIDFVSRLIEDKKLDADHYSNVLVHRIAGDEHLKTLGASSKMNAEWSFLQHLHDLGREAAKAWLDEHYDGVGERSTLDIRSLFMDSA